MWVSVCEYRVESKCTQQSVFYMVHRAMMLGAVARLVIACVVHVTTAAARAMMAVGHAVRMWKPYGTFFTLWDWEPERYTNFAMEPIHLCAGPMRERCDRLFEWWKKPHYKRYLRWLQIPHVWSVANMRMHCSPAMRKTSAQGRNFSGCPVHTRAHAHAL